jgi:hypothetical protein
MTGAGQALAPMPRTLPHVLREGARHAVLPFKQELPGAGSCGTGYRHLPPAGPDTAEAEVAGACRR